MTAEEDPDRTIVVPRAPPRPPPLRRLALVALALLTGFGWTLFRLLQPSHPPPLPPPGRVAGAAAVVAHPPLPPHSPEFAFTTAGEAAIAADVPEHLRLFRFAPDPRVIVLDFASLAEQGRMLNRVAALVEKANLPRGRVLSDAELATAIAAGGDTPETFYYGHDYRAADLVRFFSLADRDQIPLNADEARLRRLITALGWTTESAVGALISIPRAGADATVSAVARATILHHELAHAAYFTDAAYAAYTRQFWHDELDARDRDDFRHFLGQAGYDTSIDDLMMNEMQAYLMHTPDPQFFTPAAVGEAADRIAVLRARFWRGMPGGWLRDATPVPPGASVLPGAPRLPGSPGPQPALQPIGQPVRANRQRVAAAHQRSFSAGRKRTPAANRRARAVSIVVPPPASGSPMPRHASSTTKTS